jgi:2-polyprenyl-3-methyl-5-hydroxy-6-metoxy-1,4-benzoquinol methylase
MEQHLHELQASYDEVAEEYGGRIFTELEQKPLDRALLDRFAEQVRLLGMVCDMGCGPGQVARYLHEQGVGVLGIDASVGMVEQARRLNPGLAFRQGTMSALAVADEMWGGIVAFYSIIHIPRQEVVAVLREWRRVLRPGGLLLLAFHQGDEVQHIEEWWSKRVSLDFVFFQRTEMEGYVWEAGFVLDESIERPPYEGVEVATRRIYIIAHKAASPGIF